MKCLYVGRCRASRILLLLLMLVGVQPNEAIFVPKLPHASHNGSMLALLDRSGGLARASIEYVEPTVEPSVGEMASSNESQSPSICIVTTSLEDLPGDLFSEEQRLQGAIVLHFIAAIYFFMLLAYVCSEYFLPSVECLCEDLKLPQDVAAATFMATATSMPEFFTNTISTLVVESEIGLGTIMGSMLFNTLGVAALVGLLTRMHVQLDWWPLTRDTIIVTLTTTLLVVCVWDGRIEWYEATVFTVCYVLYFVVMFFNERLKSFAMHYIHHKWNLCRRLQPAVEDGIPERKCSVAVLGQGIVNGVLVGVSGTRGNVTIPPNAGGQGSNPVPAQQQQIVDGTVIPVQSDTENSASAKWLELMRFPDLAGPCWRTVVWFITWPFRIVVFLTIPDPLRFRKLYPLTFLCCIVWIGLCAYIVFWMISVIGNTFGVPDTVMGMTFLAFGGCMPEAASAVTLIRRGNGAMGISNSLGANSLAILFSLGLPWFIRTMVNGGAATGGFVSIQSYGVQYSVLALFAAILTLYIVLYIAKYTIRKLVGVALAVGYLLIVTFMILVELDVFFPANNRC
ncbi:sodium/potassium/calcium exchanger 4-like isoform X1 [Anopheles darlingi]|uniref:sodium/potassium/calcium exchanger 4-like isoform X1 n=2 Tax=Anopheles darlingi TaxID=43151 RepID=UPI0021005D24|nr:sodium/potassium/calcium exchanger 4-like isoform X1 [Anopheles darlingi]